MTLLLQIVVEDLGCVPFKCTDMKNMFCKQILNIDYIDQFSYKYTLNLKESFAIKTNRYFGIKVNVHICANIPEAVMVQGFTGIVILPVIMVK